MAAPKGNRNHATYGFSHTRIDNIYKSMISRCYCKSNIRYHRYGGRGIEVCEEWKNDKMKFFDWAFSNGYSEMLTLDRKNVNEGYFPENCRWVTQKEQQNNRSNNRVIEFNGVSHTLGEWSDITGIKLATIWNRLKSGWSVEDALTRKPVVGNNQYSKAVMLWNS